MTKAKLQDALRELRRHYHDQIAIEIENTDKSYADIGATFGVSEQLVYQVARLRGLCRTAPQPNAEQVNPGKKPGALYLHEEVGDNLNPDAEAN